MLLYIEMRPMKEKQVETLTSFPKRKEGIINTIAIINIFHITYLSIVIYMHCDYLFSLSYWEGICVSSWWKTKRNRDTTEDHYVIEITTKRERQTEWGNNAEV